jgi:hypothetical protein
MTSLLLRSRAFLATGDVFDYMDACLLSRYVVTAVSFIFHFTMFIDANEVPPDYTAKHPRRWCSSEASFSLNF